MTNVISTENGAPKVVVHDVRILHVTTAAKTLGFLAGQVAFMRRHGFSLYSAGGEACGIPKDWPVPFSTVEMTRRITPFRDCIAILRLIILIKRIRPTIVQGHTPKGGLLAMIAATLSGVPIRIFQVHGLPHVAAHGMRRRLLVLATRVACSLAHSVFCVSHSMHKILLDERLCSPEKAGVLGNGSSGGVDASKLDPAIYSPAARNEFRSALGVSQRAVVLVFAGRIVRDKGIAELVRAWQELRSRFSDLHMVVAGESESQDPIPPGTRKVLGSDARIHLLGVCRDMPRVYSACDIVVLPTYREGFPNVLLEAAAMGLPSVATRVPGCTDAVVDGVTGTLVPPYDSGALASAIAKYVTNIDLRRQHGAAGRARVLRDFQPEIIYHEVHRRYCDLLLSSAEARARKGYSVNR
jgi:glycosyltransferase involved in cell wall biosynthesis